MADRQVSGASDGDYPSVKVLGNFVAKGLLDAVHGDRRQKVTVGKLGESFFLPLYAGKAFHVIVPGGNVLVSDGPVYGYSVFGIGLKVKITPAVAVATPHDGATAYVIAPHPVEAFLFTVGMFVIFDEPVLRGRPNAVAGAALFGIMFG